MHVKGSLKLFLKGCESDDENRKSKSGSEYLTSSNQSHFLKPYTEDVHLTMFFKIGNMKWEIKNDVDLQDKWIN